MQQIADWLQKLGLGQYAQRFAENGIDVSVLHYLTDQDLEKIGVLFRPPWGSRSHHGTISLVPLDRHQVRQMVEELAARHAPRPSRRPCNNR
jgi:hypothetical protein